VVIGVAFDKSDHELRWLIQQSLMRLCPFGSVVGLQLEIVNPCENDRNARLELFPKEVRQKHKSYDSLEDYTRKASPG
jgi:hypothetical protein